MALQPSRPGFMLAAAIVFLALPFLWANFTSQPIDWRFVAAGVVFAAVFLLLGVRYRKQLRGGTGGPSAA